MHWLGTYETYTTLVLEAPGSWIENQSGIAHCGHNPNARVVHRRNIEHEIYTNQVLVAGGSYS